MNDKISIKKWLIIFATSIVIGVIIAYIMTWYIFRPDFLNTHAVLMNILHNIGHRSLKLKAYIPLFLGIAPFVICIIWWIMPNMVTEENYGNARFATKKDYEKIGISSDNGLILGTNIIYADYAKTKISSYDFVRANKPLSTLIVAPPGRGKTAGIIIPNLLTIPNSCVVFDIKGELLQKTAGYRQKHFNNEVQVFSPFSWDNTLFFNPFDKSIVKKMEFIHIKKLANQIAETIFVAEKGKENDHWVVSAKTMFVFFAEYFMQKDKQTSLGQLSQAPKMDFIDYLGFYEYEYDENGNISLDEEGNKKCKSYDKEKMINSGFWEVVEGQEDKGEVTKLKFDENDQIIRTDKDTFKEWLKIVALDESIDETTRNQARAYSTAAENEFASIKSTYDTFMKVFSNPQVANATSKMSFAFDDLREGFGKDKKRLSLYVVIQTEDMEILAPLVRIFTETLFKTLMSGKENSDPNKFIYCFLDEFVRFGRMPFLLEAPALCRSYGLLPVFVTQSYEQIKKYYGEDDLGIIRSNAGYQVIFAMNSTKDAKEISELIGDFTRKKTSISQGNFDFFKSNQSQSKEAYKLVTDQDIKNQSSEDLLVLVGGFVKLPIKCKVPYWFKNPVWNGADKIQLEKNDNNANANNNADKKDDNANASSDNKANASNKTNTDKPKPKSEFIIEGLYEVETAKGKIGV